MHPRFPHLLLVLLTLAGVLRAEGQSRPATPDETALFKAAMQNTKQDTEHWAYTETIVLKASKGRERGETVVRFDPSKPYAEQYTPLKVEGKEPTEKHLKKYRERGEKRGERVARAAAAATDPSLAARPAAPTVRISGNRVTLDLEHPRVVSEEDGRVLFEVPLQGTAKNIPVEKFEVRVLVGTATRQLQRVDLRLRESFRVKLIAKVKEAEAHMEFAVVDPKFGPVLVSSEGDFGLSLLFMPVNATFTNTRTEWQRVKPYNDRLQVKLGPLEVLDL